MNVLLAFYFATGAIWSGTIVVAVARGIRGRALNAAQASGLREKDQPRYARNYARGAWITAPLMFVFLLAIWPWSVFAYLRRGKAW